MNSNDISSQNFEKVSFGYKPEDVDEYLISVATEFSNLEKENAELTKKLQILADKVREYRQDEEAVKEALLDAKKVGHRTINDAKKKSDEIISRANSQAEQLIRDAVSSAEEEVDALRGEIEAEEKHLTNVQETVSNFKKELFDMYKVHLELISSMPDTDEDESDDFDDIEDEEEVSTETAKK
jgi:cell division initiation protein